MGTIRSRRWSAGRALGLLLVALSAVLFNAVRHLGAEPGQVPCLPPAKVMGAADCPMDPPPPVVAVRVRVPASVAPGQELTYRICVENTSRAAAHHVLVRNPLPAHVTFVRAEPEPAARDPELVWRFGTLEPGACKEIVLVLAPTGAGDVTNCARVQFEHGQCVSTRIDRPELSLRKIGPAQAALYDVLTYQLVVTNTGRTEVAGVTLTDTLPAGLEHASGKNALNWDLGKLAPGQSRQVEYQVIAKKADRFCNQAVVTAAGGVREEASHCVVVGEPRLELIMKGPERRFLNAAAVYQIVVSNPGTLPATGVTITDLLPPRTTLVSASPGAQTSPTQVQWSIGTLAPGASRSVQLSLRAGEAGEVRNQASATAARGLAAQAEAVTVFEGATGLTVDIDDRDDPVPVGKDTSYVITVINQGQAPATKVQVVATAPEQMEVTDAKGAGKEAREGNRVTFEPITLAPGATAKYEVFVKPIRPGDVRFRVELTAAELTAGAVRREESTTIYPDMPVP